MKKLVYILLLLFFGNSVFGQIGRHKKKQESMLYLGEMTFRAGYHLFSESSDWLDSKTQALDDDILFKDRADFNGSGVDTTSVTGMSGLPMISFELMGGLLLKNFPGLRGIEALKKFRGLRASVEVMLYPFANSTSFDYSGGITYNTPGASDPNLVTRTYNGKITMQERYFILGQSFGLFYFYEDGFTFGDSKNKLIPYIGGLFGISFINGKRKIKLETDPLLVNTAANGDNNYTVDANIQESFFNSLGIRISPVLGVQYRLGGAHYIDLRGGYVLQSGSVNMNRNGTFTETATSTSDSVLYTVSEKVKEGERSASFDQSGIVIQLGYTVGLK